jgi:mannan endo-1,4-beta-mannosidase
MRSRIIMFVALSVATIAVTLAANRIQTFAPLSPGVVHAPLKPRVNSYLGTYETGAPPSYDAIGEFAQAAGAQPNLAGYFSGWAEPFASAFARKLHRHGVIPFVQIDPTLASVAGVADGAYDVYLTTYAERVREFGHAVVIGFGHEMNTTRYSWGYTHVPPQTFVAAWRHIVNLFHEEGADNVTWLWTINADTSSSGPVADWWPGGRYVTWVGIDGYYYRPSNTFANVFGRTIDQVQKFTNKPVLLSETAVGPRAGQLNKIADLFTGMAKYRTLGLVWFDKDQDDGIYHQDWRIEGNQAAEATFRLGVANLKLARS